MNEEETVLNLLRSWALQPIAPATFDNFLKNYKKGLEEIGYIKRFEKENAELKDKLSLANKMNENNYNKYCEALKENARLKREIAIKDGWCQLLIDIGLDYDGLEKVDSFKRLIDELCEYAKNAMECDDRTPIYENERCRKNILDEVLEEKE